MWSLPWLLTLPPQKQVSCGPDGIFDGAHQGLIFIDMGSIAPDMSRSIAGRVGEKGIAMLDAPVTGNPKVAAAGKLRSDGWWPQKDL